MMTHQDMIDVIIADKEGKRIQARSIRDNSSDGWVDNNSPQWDFRDFVYRAKPEPLVLWAEIMTDGRHIQSSLNQFRPTNGGTIKKFIEEI